MQNIPTTTISYFTYNQTEDLTEKIYDLHVQGLLKVVTLISAFLFAFFAFILVSSGINLVEKGMNFSVLEIVEAVCAVAVGLFGILTALGGVRAAKVQSRGTSGLFAKALQGQLVVFMLYLVYSYCISFPKLSLVWEELYGWKEATSISWIILSLIVVGFVGCYLVLKAKQFHSVINEYILGVMKQQGLQNLEKPLSAFKSN